MTTILNTSSMPFKEREEAIRDVVWGSVVRVEIDHHLPPKDIRVGISLSGMGRIGVCSVDATATTVRRTPKLAREDTEPAVFMGLQVTGSSLVVQNGREALLRSGEFALYDTARPLHAAVRAGD